VRRRIGKPSVPGLLFYAALIVAIVVGLIIKGDTGNTIAGVAAAILAMVVASTIGFGVASNENRDRGGGGGTPPRL
jgi:hypothetical protein